MLKGKVAMEDTGDFIEVNAPNLQFIDIKFIIHCIINFII